MRMPHKCVRKLRQHSCGKVKQCEDRIADKGAPYLEILQLTVRKPGSAG